MIGGPYFRETLQQAAPLTPPDARSARLLGESYDTLIALSCRALGIKPLRVEILRYIISAGETSVADLMAEFGLTRNGILTHVRALVATGLLQGRRVTHPRGSGPITYWSVDAEVAAIMLDTLVAYMLH